MAGAILENSLELSNYFVDRHFDKSWDYCRKYVNGRKVDDRRSLHHRTRLSPPTEKEPSPHHKSRERASTLVRSTAPDYSGRRASLTRAAPTPTAAAAASFADPVPSSFPGSRRKQRNRLPSPERDEDHPSYRRDSIQIIQQECETSDRVLREYELESDDPKRDPESVLPARELRALRTQARSDSAMASGYGDTYGQAPYASDPRTRSQPARTRYYDDEDSDYDEHTGRRSGKTVGRGHDEEREYDRIFEATERYHGPASAGPLAHANRPPTTQQDSYRPGHDGPYSGGVVAQYSRRSDGAVDRQERSYVSRRSASRGRDERDRSYSRSPSRRRDRSYSRSPSRSRSRSKEGGIRGQLENAFDTSGRGIGVGLAGAVIGGLAGREFGQKNRQRDVVLGALLGGLGANAAENQYNRWKEGKERDIRRDEDRFEQKWEGRVDGRSRSNVRNE